MRLPPKDYTKWHRWFAWYPVEINSEWVWYETVERQRLPEGFADFEWEYRPLKEEHRFVPDRPNDFLWINLLGLGVFIALVLLGVELARMRP